MTSTAPTPQQEFTHVQQSPSAVQSARQHPVAVLIGAIFVIAVVILVWGSQPDDTTPLSPHNSGPGGARAAAEILADQGVTVRHVTTLAAASATDPSSTTLVIALPEDLMREQVEAIMDYPGDITFLGGARAVSQLAELGTDSGGEYVPGVTATAQCSDPDAVAAGEVSVSTGAVADAGGPGVQACFTTADGLSAYVTAERDGRTVRVLASSDIATNARLTELGHAALTLRALGHHPQVEWYVADLFDTSLPSWTPVDGEQPDELDLGADVLPPWFLPVAVMAFLTVLMAGLWRGRRFGRLVDEPLPVVVPAAEAVRGRARLYRRSGDVPHASAALRAHSASRMGRRLGVPASSTPTELIDAIHHATGRRREELAHLLTGPLPTTTTDMMAMIKELDSLESEVHRP